MNDNRRLLRLDPPTQLMALSTWNSKTCALGFSKNNCLHFSLQSKIYSGFGFHVILTLSLLVEKFRGSCVSHVINLHGASNKFTCSDGGYKENQSQHVFSQLQVRVTANHL